MSDESQKAAEPFKVPESAVTPLPPLEQEPSSMTLSLGGKDHEVQIKPPPSDPSPDGTPEGAPETPKPLRVAHGTYVGPGCPDTSKRLLARDQGWDYTPEHPARPGEVLAGLDEAAERHLVKTGVAKRG